MNPQPRSYDEQQPTGRYWRDAEGYLLHEPLQDDRPYVDRSPHRDLNGGKDRREPGYTFEPMEVRHG